MVRASQHDHCELNFSEIDTTSVRYIGGGTYGSVFRVNWKYHGDETHVIPVALRVEFPRTLRDRAQKEQVTPSRYGSVQHDLEDPFSPFYNDVFVHARMERMLETGATPNYTHLYGYSLCMFPFDEPLGKAILDAMPEENGRALAKMKQRYTQWERMKKVKLTPEAEQSLVRDLYAQFTLTEYVPTSLDRVITKRNVSWHYHQMELSNVTHDRAMCAVLFQCLYAMYVAARMYKIIHMDITPNNLVVGPMLAFNNYSESANTGMGMRFMLRKRMWFLPWSDMRPLFSIPTPDPRHQLPKTIVVKLIDFGLSYSLDSPEKEKNRAIETFRDPFQWPHSHHGISQSLRRFQFATRGFMRSKMAPYLSLSSVTAGGLMMRLELREKERKKGGDYALEAEYLHVLQLKLLMDNFAVEHKLSIITDRTAELATAAAHVFERFFHPDSFYYNPYFKNDELRIKAFARHYLSQSFIRLAGTTALLGMIHKTEMDEIVAQFRKLKFFEVIENQWIRPTLVKGIWFGQPPQVGPMVYKIFDFINAQVRLDNRYESEAVTFADGVNPSHFVSSFEKDRTTVKDEYRYTCEVLLNILKHHVFAELFSVNEDDRKWQDEVSNLREHDREGYERNGPLYGWNNVSDITVRRELLHQQSKIALSPRERKWLSLNYRLTPNRYDALRMFIEKWKHVKEEAKHRSPIRTQQVGFASASVEPVHSQTRAQYGRFLRAPPGQSLFR